MRRYRFLVIGLLGLALTVPALAQVPTGTLSGRATDGVAPLPGVTVTVTSPNLQGARTAVTSINGDYIFRFLPPGEYRVRFELSGFQTVEASLRVAAAQNPQLDAEMPMTRLEEEITVTGSYETISTSSTASTTYDKETLEQLPVGRTLAAAVFLSPGVTNTGPGGNLVISGAQSHESMYMVNGVVVNENLRGQATSLFIEDAIQETTTSTSGISAEYGRFAGGVVNMLTKSGGNQFSGSFRLNLSNDSWSDKTPLTVSQADEDNKIYEATLGGFILKDRLWFFLAGRDFEQTAENQTFFTNIPWTFQAEETRYEAKLTFSASANHRLVGTYIEREVATPSRVFGAPVDLTQIINPSIPEDLRALNYTGVLTDSFFVEGQYSERTLTFKSYGSYFTDQIQGTPVRSRVHGVIGNSPIFCAVCPDTDESRDNRNILLKASYFLSTDNWGTHDIVAGYDNFRDYILSNNYQSGSSWQIFGFSMIFDGPNWYPLWRPDGQTWIVWYPILELSEGSKFDVNSIFINDRWRLNNNWSFNFGLRYDKNDGKNSIGAVVSKDDRISPRLGVTFDPFGDGRWIFNASYSHYVTALANTGNVGNQSPAGSPAILAWDYFGPAINDPFDPANPVTAHQALEILWDWFFNVYGGTTNFDLLWLADFAGANRLIDGSLKSPYAEEIALGVVHRLGARGMVRLDYTGRQFKDLYETTLLREYGTVNVEALGQTWGQQDLGFIGNSSYLERKYDGVNLQVQYRLDRVDLGMNYTWSHLRGNFDGETAGSGPVTSTNNPAYYPEYREDSWSNPRGLLGPHQRHKFRSWVIWNVINTRYNKLSLGFMQNFFDGTRYSAAGSINTRPYVTNPGYITPPSSVTYYFSERGEYKTDNLARTDISLNYSFLLPALGTNIEFFLQPRVTNVFNNRNVVAPNTDVTVIAASPFNPWTEQPVEGVNWRKGDNFGKATSPGAYQAPRTYTVSFGVRF